MGVMDKFLNYMKLNDEEDEGFYDDDYLDDEEEVEPVKKFGAAKNRQQAQDEEALDDKGKRTSQPKVTPIHRTVTKKMPGTGMEVCVIKPTSVEDAREITETPLRSAHENVRLDSVSPDRRIFRHGDLPGDSRHRCLRLGTDTGSVEREGRLRQLHLSH